jgi:hypothetical protein
MFFLKHVLPLIIVSITTGYVLARLDFSSIGNGTAGHHQALAPAGPAGRASQNAGDLPATASEEPVSGRGTAVARLQAPPVRRAPARDAYTDRINEAIKAAFDAWSADRFLDEPPARDETAAANEGRVPQGLISAGFPDQIESSAEVSAGAFLTARPEPEAQVDGAGIPPQGRSTAIPEHVPAPTPQPTLTLAELLAARWAVDGHSAAVHLPSLLTTCERLGEEADCWSREHSMQTDGRRQTVRTKSLIQGFSGFDFAIKYRHMLVDAGQGGEHWAAGTHYLGCAIKTRDRILCENPGRSKRFTYTRITDEQLASRFGLALLASAEWDRAGEAALFLPSRSTRCERDAAQLVCWTGTRILASGQGQYRVKTKSLIQNPQERKFVVKYRNLVTEAPGQVGWEADTHEVSCTLVGFDELVCQEGDRSRSYRKLDAARVSTGRPVRSATNSS